MLSMIGRILPVVVAGLASLVAAQTPSDFSPGSLQRLGISFKRIDIDPAGTQVQGLSQVAEVPQIRIPQSALTGPNGQLVPNRKFMIFLIDIDVVRNNISTTVLHWFQPDLTPQGDSLVIFGNASTPNPSASASSASRSPAPSSSSASAPSGSPSPSPQPQPQPPAPPVSPQAAQAAAAPAQLDVNAPSILLQVANNDRAPATLQRRSSSHLYRRQQQAVDPNDPPGLGPGPLTIRDQAPYLGPSPPPGPPHRYVAILFAQPTNFTIPKCFSNIITPPGSTDRTGRLGFDIDQFIAAARIRPAKPIAGNYFRAQNPTPGPLEAPASVTALRNNKCGAPAPRATSSSAGAVAASSMVLSALSVMTASSSSSSSVPLVPVSIATARSSSAAASTLSSPSSSAAAATSMATPMPLAASPVAVA